ncbi:MAG: hypothetical protein ACI91T_002849, partial [Natronomonas sp.]
SPLREGSGGTRDPIVVSYRRVHHEVETGKTAEPTNGARMDGSGRGVDGGNAATPHRSTPEKRHREPASAVLRHFGFSPSGGSFQLL